MTQSPTGSSPVQREMTAARWMFNPFIRVGGAPSLAIGLLIIAASGLAAGVAGVHFDGLLDFHPGYAVPLWVPVLEGLVNWSVIAVIFGLTSLLLAPRNVRFIDIAGTQAVARFPLLPAALVCSLPAVRSGNEQMVAAAAEGRLVLPQGITIVLASLVTMTCWIWMIWLMWKAMTVSSNLRGGRALGLFVAAALVGEVATKFLIAMMLPLLD